MQTFNLTALLNEEKSKIVIGDKEYAINDRFSDIVKLDEIASDPSVKGEVGLVKKFIEVAFSPEDAAEIMAYNFTVMGYKKIIDCIKKAIMGEDDDKSTGGAAVV